MYTKNFLGRFTVFEGRILTSMLTNEKPSVNTPLHVTCRVGVTLDFAQRCGIFGKGMDSDDCRISRFVEYAEKEGSLAFIYTEELPGHRNRLMVPYNSPVDSLELIYRYQEYEYRREDARRQLDYLIFGDEGDPESLTEEEWAKEAQSFFDESYPNVTPSEALQAIPQYIERFEDGIDCNVDENSRWEQAIRDELDDLNHYPN